MKIRIISAPWYAGYEVLLEDKISDGRRGIVIGPLVITELDNNHFKSIDPTFRMDRAEAQQLMDELWQCGVRPANGVGNVGELDATKKHLSDMQRLVFNGNLKTP